MVQLLFGNRGTGKSTKLIEQANRDSLICDGDITFIDVNNEKMFELHHKVRLVNAMDFDILNIENFHGFLCGLIAEDYDLEKVYIDDLYKMIDLDENKLKDLIGRLNRLEEKFDTTFILSMHHENNNLPDELKAYALES